MRWFWRADPPTLLLDGLLEGSLVCAAYLVLALGWSTNAPLPLPVFWLAATAGLLSARQPRSRWRDFFSVGALTIVAGLIGWLWDDGARQALLSRADPATVLGAHWAGWILGIAVLRGAVHSDTRWESEISSDAITYSLPILAFALVLYLGSGRTFPPMAAIAVAVAIVAAMLSIGLARTREMEAMGPASQGGRVWRAISGTILILAAIGVPIALALGTLAQEPIFRAARWSWGVAGAIGAWLAHWIEWLASQFLNGGHGAGPSSAPSPTAYAPARSGGALGGLRRPRAAGRGRNLAARGAALPDPPLAGKGAGSDGARPGPGGADSRFDPLAIAGCLAPAAPAPPAALADSAAPAHVGGGCVPRRAGRLLRAARPGARARRNARRGRCRSVCSPPTTSSRSTARSRSAIVRQLEPSAAGISSASWLAVGDGRPGRGGPAPISGR